MLKVVNFEVEGDGKVGSFDEETGHLISALKSANRKVAPPLSHSRAAHQKSSHPPSFQRFP